MERKASSSAAAVWAILRKECRSEWRTRYGLNAALLFAVTSLAAVSFAVGPLGDRTDILSALLWVVLFFAALSSLSHAFVREIEGHTLTLLRLVASPTAIALGKLFFNLIFLVVIEAVTVPGAPQLREREQREIFAAPQILDRWLRRCGAGPEENG